MLNSQPSFNSIYVVLCGVTDNSADPPSPIYVAMLNLNDGSTFQIDVSKLHSHRQPPYPTGAQALLVSIGVEDLLSVHLALGWRMPERLLDLIVEFRNITNGKFVTGGPGLVGSLIWYGLPAVSGPRAVTLPHQVRQQLAAIASLFRRMRPDIDWGRALLRGRYLIAVARIELAGVPVDASALEWLSANWPAVRERFIAEVDEASGCYRIGRFNIALFDDFLERRRIAWPRDVYGALDLSDSTFKDMTRSHSELLPLKELRATLSSFQPAALAVGKDRRNRTSLRPFASRTGRNQPSTKASIFGGPAWVRFLVRPESATGIALVDWSQQEFGIAAALSGDEVMKSAYHAGDPYIALATMAGEAPEGATAKTHPEVRERFKTCALGVQYGMGARTLARMVNTSIAGASSLLERHKRVFPRFWQWSDAIEAEGLLRGRLQSVFGWQVAVGADVNPRFLRNFPMQANGAEMLRLACCLVTEAGIKICAPLHDALLIEAPLSELDAAVAETQRLMAEASSVVLDGFELRSEARDVRHPDRLGDDRGRAIWSIVARLIEEDRA